MAIRLTTLPSRGIMLARVRRWATLASGWFFVALGIAGLFLPILQGVLLIFIGLLILSSEYVWAHRVLKRVEQRFPKLAERAHTVSQSTHNWLHRCLRRSG
ncbi:hypothetical protein SBA2_640029 [Acidobacteriia bacterium SbA2]|nr:hypothetical protein SBA2_640029 [Acidobacteriia bacterium SbA2]